jgi:hypothetical protein
MNIMKKLVCVKRFLYRVLHDILSVFWENISEIFPIQKYHTNIAEILNVLKILIFKFYKFIVKFVCDREFHKFTRIHTFFLNTYFMPDDCTYELLKH